MSNIASRTNPLAVAALVAVLVVGAGCGTGTGPAPSASAADTFRYAMETSPTTLDPAKAQDVATIDLLSNIYEGLVSYDQQNRCVGQLAERWVAADGGKTWTFTLRKNAKFHDGHPVTAEDVKWSLERACAKDFNSPTASNYLRDIVGVTDELDGKSTGISGIQVLDPQTVRFTLDKPRAYFLGKLTYICASVLEKGAVNPGQINDVKSSIGTGPFKLVRYDVDQEVEIDANSYYYLGPPKVRRILRPVVKDASTRLNLYRTGSLDILGLDRKDIKSIEADPKLHAELKYEMRPAVFYVGLSQKNYPPFRDRRVRRAFAMAIDRKKICSVLLDGMPQANGLTAPGVLGFRDDYAGLPFDPIQAEKELAEAGYPKGKGLPPLQFVFRSQAPDSQHVSEGVASSLRENLGMDIQLSTMDWSAFLDGRNKGKFQSYFLSWYADYLDPQNFLSFLLTSGSPLNHDGYANPDFDRLCELGDTTTDEPSRIKDYQAAEDILIQDAGRVPIYYQRDAILVSPHVKGIRSNLFGQMPNLTVQKS